MAKTKQIEPNSTPSNQAQPSRQILYSQVSRYAPDAIKVLYEMLHNAKNESVRIAAANKILDKCIPDLKAMELSGNEGGDIILRLVREDKPTYDGDTSSNPKLS